MYINMRKKRSKRRLNKDLCSQVQLLGVFISFRLSLEKKPGCYLRKGQAVERGVMGN